MPTKPPITQDSWSSVSDRANTLVRTRSGTSRWISASSDSLPSDWLMPAIEPERSSPDQARRTAPRRSTATASAIRRRPRSTSGVAVLQHRADRGAERAAEAGRRRSPGRAAGSCVSSQPGSGCSRSRNAMNIVRKPDRKRRPALQRSAVTTTGVMPTLRDRVPRRSSPGMPTWLLALGRVDPRRQQDGQDRAADEDQGARSAATTPARSARAAAAIGAEIAAPAMPASEIRELALTSVRPRGSAVAPRRLG